MIFGVQDEVWIVAMGCVLLNLALTLLITNITAHRAYKRGYDSAHIANEALALGRLMEASRERYYAGDALARALEDRHDDSGSLDPADPAG